MFFSGASPWRDPGDAHPCPDTKIPKNGSVSWNPDRKAISAIKCANTMAKTELLYIILQEKEMIEYLTKYIWQKNAPYLCCPMRSCGNYNCPYDFNMNTDFTRHFDLPAGKCTDAIWQMCRYREILNLCWQPRKNNPAYFSPFVLYSCMRPCYPFITVIDRSPEWWKGGSWNAVLS